jgi:uncharacterized membrane protein
VCTSSSVYIIVYVRDCLCHDGGMFRHNLDIIGCVLVTLLTVLLALSFPDTFSQSYALLGLMIILLTPGYVLTTLNALRRFYLTLALSILSTWLIQFLFGTPLWYSHWALMTATFSLFMVFIGGLAIVRRSRIRQDEQFSLYRMPPPNRTNILTTLGLVAILALIVGLSNQLPRREPFTEFYILGPDKSNHYPVQLTPGEPYELTFGVRNHEDRTLSYRLVVPDFRVAESVYPFTLSNEQTWEQKILLAAPSGAGQTKVPFTLFIQEQAVPYRQLHLFVNLVPSSAEVAP